MLGFCAEWVARQITEAFPWNEAPRYMIRDRDCIYGAVVTRRMRAMGIRDKPIALPLRQYDAAGVGATEVQALQGVQSSSCLPPG